MLGEENDAPAKREVVFAPRRHQEHPLLEAWALEPPHHLEDLLQALLRVSRREEPPVDGRGDVCDESQRVRHVEGELFGARGEFRVQEDIRHDHWKDQPDLVHRFLHRRVVAPVSRVKHSLPPRLDAPARAREMKLGRAQLLGYLREGHAPLCVESHQHLLVASFPRVGREPEVRRVHRPQIRHLHFDAEGADANVDPVTRVLRVQHPVTRVERAPQHLGGLGRGWQEPPGARPWIQHLRAAQDAERGLALGWHQQHVRDLLLAAPVLLREEAAAELRERVACARLLRGGHGEAAQRAKALPRAHPRHEAALAERVSTRQGNGVEHQPHAR
mmetsp:Transcript_57114/g.136238  ORF Transcript_57114/g.136238 Transcript_57114/m.136238 type:complete len:331 (+) Transcript_57114:32-1024(+)